MNGYAKRLPVLSPEPIRMSSPVHKGAKLRWMWPDLVLALADTLRLPLNRLVTESGCLLCL